jgi:predicted AAA+ superfamily ATPase
MLKRNIFNYLRSWKHELSATPGLRKPLIVRGARQVGKTSAIEEFGNSKFESFVALNLEKSVDQALFSNVGDIKQVVAAIELHTKKRIIPGQTLLFIDEIQNSSEALKQLRYFYEDMPQLHVIAAGSLLDVFIDRNKFEIPVGRVEYCYMHPCTFDEFLLATNNQIALEMLSQFTLSDSIPTAQHGLLLRLFFEYALIGGMPEVVARYAAGETPLALDRIYESLLVGYRDDIGKYATPAQAVYLRHCLEHAPRSVGMQIAYQHFAESKFRSREISQAFDTLEFAHLVTRVYSSRSVQPPLVPNQRKAPKLLFVDCGLVNYKLGQREKFATLSALENVFQGQLSEQMVGQTLLSFGQASEPALTYWYRDKVGASAEVDYLYLLNGQLIPIEVKAGSSQKIQSLYVMIDELMQLNPTTIPHAIRVYSGPLTVQKMSTPKENQFTLISLPYYLLFRLPELNLHSSLASI